MNAPAFIERKYGARFNRWLTANRRDQICEAIVHGMDADMRVRLIRAAASDLSGYARGFDEVAAACDLIDDDLRAELSTHPITQGA